MHVKTTREILADSFRELAAKKPISKITVTSIAENCAMTPQTFYNHFADKYDLISWIYNTDLQKVLERHREAGLGWREILAAWVGYFAKNRDFIMNALKHTRGQDAFARQVALAHIGALSAEVRKKTASEQLPEELLNAIKVYCYGANGFLYEWLFDNMPIPQEKMVELLDRCMPEPLRAFLHKP